MDKVEHGDSTHTHTGDIRRTGGGPDGKDTHRRLRKRATLTAQEAGCFHTLHQTCFTENISKKHGKGRAEMVAGLLWEGGGGAGLLEHTTRPQFDFGGGRNYKLVINYINLLRGAAVVTTVSPRDHICHTADGCLMAFWCVYP